MAWSQTKSTSSIAPADPDTKPWTNLRLLPKLSVRVRFLTIGEAFLQSLPAKEGMVSAPFLDRKSTSSPLENLPAPIAKLTEAT